MIFVIKHLVQITGEKCLREKLACLCLRVISYDFSTKGTKFAIIYIDKTEWEKFI
jgi:hypothetical protein